MTRKTEEYPEHTKLLAVNDKSQTVGTFIEWLSSQGFVLCKWSKARYGYEDELVPLGLSINVLLAQHFEIDLDKLENEKRAMLDKLRKQK